MTRGSLAGGAGISAHIGKSCVFFDASHLPVKRLARGERVPDGAPFLVAVWAEHMRGEGASEAGAECGELAEAAFVAGGFDEIGGGLDVFSGGGAQWSGASSAIKREQGATAVGRKCCEFRKVRVSKYRILSGA